MNTFDDGEPFDRAIDGFHGDATETSIADGLSSPMSPVLKDTSTSRPSSQAADV